MLEVMILDNLMKNKFTWLLSSVLLTPLAQGEQINNDHIEIHQFNKEQFERYQKIKKQKLRELKKQQLKKAQEKAKPDIKVIPYFFSSDSLGYTGGLIGLWKGAGQKQAAIFGTVLGSSKSSWLGFLSASNYVLSPQSRFLFGAQFYEADFKQADLYLGANTANNSNPLNKIKADSREAKHQLSMRYILPLGAGVKNPLYAALTPERKITGHTPWTSGVSSFEVRPFYQSRSLTKESAPLPKSDFANTDAIWAIASQLRWDNRDTANNPSAGSLSELTVTASVATDDTPDWWKWEASQSLYFDLGTIKNVIDKQTLAFNVYTADTPSWNKTTQINGQDLFRRPPEFAAPSLGGLYRLRSYEAGRFVDRAALSYSLEYRMNPAWQPLGQLPVFNWYQIGWWQWVAFAEVGRVAESYDLAKLHQDMKWSFGGGMRFQIEGVVVRSELAVGDEGSAVRIMINQPF